MSTILDFFNNNNATPHSMMNTNKLHFRRMGALLAALALLLIAPAQADDKQAAAAYNAAAGLFNTELWDNAAKG